MIYYDDMASFRKNTTIEDLSMCLSSFSLYVRF